MTEDRQQPALSTQRALRLLQKGKLKETHGLLPWSSNYTFLMDIEDGEYEAMVIYKPRRGERPLWDFPDGTLCQREVAAFMISEALGWGIVPPTILRRGPHGIGMVQLFIEHNPDRHYFNLDTKYRPQLYKVALFDWITNNADRKAGHCLLDAQGKIWAIDHGICFHSQPKLRTVIWDFAGEKIPPDLLDDMRRLCDKLGQPDFSSRLLDMLSRHELDSLAQRTQEIISAGVFPHPGSGRHYPWPPV